MKLKAILIGTALCFAAISSAAQAGQMVIAEARGVGLKPGAMLDTSKPLTLKEGQHVTLISSSGATLKLDGPYNGAPDTDKGGTDIGAKLASLTTANNVRLNQVGTTRTGAAQDKLPSAWVLNVSHAGNVCLRDGTPPVLWRNAAKSAVPTVIAPADRSWRLALDWPSGTDSLPVSSDISIHGGATYFVTVGGNEIAVTVQAVPAALETDTMRAAWMADRGCTEQAQAIDECVPLKLPEAIQEWLKRNRDWLAHITPFLVAVISVVLVTLTVTKIDVLARLETLVADYRIAIFTPPEPQDTKIVIAAINEDTLAQFPYREPVNREFLANLITAIAAKHPRAIGLDILLDNPSEPTGDAKLREVLRTLQVPIAVSYTTDSGVVTDEESKFLDAFVPKKDRSFATLASDNHDIVRAVYPGGPGKDGKYIPSFALALAKYWGINAPDVLVPIVWHGQPDANTPAFAEYPSQLVPVLPESFFKGKIVLIGSDLSLTDRHTTPFDVLTSKDRGQLPGIVVQANGLSQLLDRKAQQQVGAFVDFLIALICAGIGAALGWVNWRLDLRIGLAAVFVAVFWVFGFALFYYDARMINLVIPTLSLAISLWATESLTGLEARRQREFIQGAFSRYVSPKVVDQLMKDPEKLALQGERRVMTFIFTDIANFTTMSEGVEGHVLQQMLNAYLEGMTACVQKYDGLVDKFIGDAVMAIFNAPLDDADHAQKAVRCALEMDRFTEAFHLEQKAKGIPFGITRIGVHTGPAVIGNFGSSTKFNYTAQGDTVNIASRLEGLNKAFGTHISVSDATKQLSPDILFRPIAAVILKGKTKSIEVWEPMQPDYPRLEFLKRYDAAFEQMKAEDPQALRAFQVLHEELPGDPCVALHFERLQAGEVGIAIEQHEK